MPLGLAASCATRQCRDRGFGLVEAFHSCRSTYALKAGEASISPQSGLESMANSFNKMGKLRLQCSRSLHEPKGTGKKSDLAAFRAGNSHYFGRASWTISSVAESVEWLPHLLAIARSACSSKQLERASSLLRGVSSNESAFFYCPVHIAQGLPCMHCMPGRRNTPYCWCRI